MIIKTAFRAREIKSLLFKRHIAATCKLMDKNDVSHKESKLKEYTMTSYMKYVKNYEQMLEKRFPSAMQVYRVFTEGIKGFFLDLKLFFKVRYILLGDEERLNVLSRKQIELYDKMPKDMIRIAPVLIFSTLPFANYVVFPIAYYYPHIFLTSHFWTPQQRNQIIVDQMKSRLINNKIILKCLKNRTNSIKESANKWREVLSILESDSHPSLNQISECKELFVSGPYGLHNLHFSHVNGLLRLHGITPRFSRLKNLQHRAFILKEMDNAIIREGGLSILQTDTLQSLCIIRGLYPDSLDKDELIGWLQKWIYISKIVDEESYSLLLHAPCLIGYNHPRNILLLEIKK